MVRRFNQGVSLARDLIKGSPNSIRSVWLLSPLYCGNKVSFIALIAFRRCLRLQYSILAFSVGNSVLSSPALGIFLVAGVDFSGLGRLASVKVNPMPTRTGEYLPLPPLDG